MYTSFAKLPFTTDPMHFQSFGSKGTESWRVAKTIGNKEIISFVWSYLRISICELRLILLDHITYCVFIGLFINGKCSTIVAGMMKNTLMDFNRMLWKGEITGTRSIFFGKSCSWFTGFYLKQAILEEPGEIFSWSKKKKKKWEKDDPTISCSHLMAELSSYQVGIMICKGVIIWQMRVKENSCILSY